MNNDIEKRNTKIVNEQIFGLIVDDRKSDQISEAFGWKKDKFDMFMSAYEKFKNFQFATEDMDTDLPLSTKISNLIDFLKSNSFKKQGIKIESPNDYLLLGYVFASIANRDMSKMSGLLKALLDK